MRRVVVMALSVVATLAPSPAPSWASSARCAGRMRPAGCQDPGPDVVWPGDRAPVFSALCDYCPSPNDAGYGCQRRPPDPGLLTLIVGGQRYRNNISPGSPPYFQALGGLCGEEGMFRYDGPLMPGMSHTIDLGGYSYPGQQPIVFFVAPAPANAELPPEPGPDASGASPRDAAQDAASPADAVVDAAPADAAAATADVAGRPRDPGGCACRTAAGLSARGGGLTGLILVVVVAGLAGRRQRTQR